jgi:hypothetical protein
MGQPRSCHSWYASAVMASSLTASDTFRSVESVGWLMPLFFGSIFIARLAMIALFSALLCLLFSSTTSGTFWRSISRRGRVPIVTQDTTPTVVMRPLGLRQQLGRLARANHGITTTEVAAKSGPGMLRSDARRG